MPLEEYKNNWVLRKKKFFLIVLYTQTLIIVLLLGVSAHLNLCIKSALLHNNFVNYAEIFKKSGNTTMEIKRLRCLALEIFKTMNKLNPYYMKEIFSKTTNLTHRPLDINSNQNKTTKYRNNSLGRLGPDILNSLSSEIKEETECEKFKKYMNDWFGLKRKCNMCSFLNV